MAAALFHANAQRARVPGVRVASAATMDWPNQPASPQAAAALRARGLGDVLAPHRSRPLDPALVGEAHLVLTMERAHLRAAAVLVPGALARTFTLREFVRRGLAIGPRDPDLPLPSWLARLDAGRDPASLLADDPADDVADPLGGTDVDFARCADELDVLTRGAVYLLFGRTAP